MNELQTWGEITTISLLNLWEKFIQSDTQDQAQEAVKNLLDVLVKKISY